MWILSTDLDHEHSSAHGEAIPGPEEVSDVYLDNLRPVLGYCNWKSCQLAALLPSTQFWITDPGPCTEKGGSSEPSSRSIETQTPKKEHILISGILPILQRNYQRGNLGTKAFQLTGKGMSATSLHICLYPKLGQKFTELRSKWQHSYFARDQTPLGELKS